jgi:2-hydroxy-6-oxonona-2,4-dienedioate hydrolase
MHFRASLEEVTEGCPAVVLVYDLSVSTRYMLPIAEHLALDLQVYSPDLRGFDLRDKPRHALTSRELADALADWMDAIELARPSSAIR